jgi:hypothetical protein
MARGFDHGTMKDASKRAVKRQFAPSEAMVAAQLRIVAQAFIDLQQNRHAADYSYLKKWSRTEVQSHVDTAATAFASWKAIQHDTLAKDYLISLLIKERKD